MRKPRGRLITPDPRLEAEYLALGGSTTHCAVYPADGGAFTCLSVNELTDANRHLDEDTFDVRTCTSCISVRTAHQPCPACGCDGVQ